MSDERWTLFRLNPGDGWHVVDPDLPMLPVDVEKVEVVPVAERDQLCEDNEKLLAFIKLLEDTRRPPPHNSYEQGWKDAATAYRCAARSIGVNLPAVPAMLEPRAPLEDSTP